MAITSRILAAVGILKIIDEVLVERISISDVDQVTATISPNDTAVPDSAYAVFLFTDNNPVGASFVQWTGDEITNHTPKDVVFDSIELSLVSTITVEVTKSG